MSLDIRQLELEPIPPQFLLPIEIVSLLEEVGRELNRARQKHPVGMHSAHEAHSVILEELEEFWDQVKLQTNQRDPKEMRKELIQTAAMALRAIQDLKL
jgi:hypothetical protein